MGKAASGLESDGNPDVTSNFEQLKTAFMAQRCIRITHTKLVPMVNANIDYLTRMIGLMQGNDNQFLAVTDNGADTTVMGDGWLILGDTTLAPRANLVGFDKDAKKKGLPIVSGAIKVRLENDTPVILQVHQGVYNSGSRTMLISEFQVRNHGLILDLVSSNHRAHVDSEKGIQAFCLSANQKLPLHLKGGLMMFAFSTPSWDNMEQLEIIDITTEVPWHPMMHSDDPMQLHSMNEKIQPSRPSVRIHRPPKRGTKVLILHCSSMLCPSLTHCIPATLSAALATRSTTQRCSFLTLQTSQRKENLARLFTSRLIMMLSQLPETSLMSLSVTPWWMAC